MQLYDIKVNNCHCRKKKHGSEYYNRGDDLKSVLITILIKPLFFIKISFKKKYIKVKFIEIDNYNYLKSFTFKKY